jgi:alpha-D-xyloside xylohydrolase
MNGEDAREVYLPEGSWVNFFSGERLEGGRWLKMERIPLEEMPVFVKADAEIPLYPEAVDCTDEMDLQRRKVVKMDDSFRGIFSELEAVYGA